MKMLEIRSRAKELGIKSFGVNKIELIREIQRTEGNFDCFGTAVDFCDQDDCCFRSLCLETPQQKKSKPHELEEQLARDMKRRAAKPARGEG